MSVAPLLPKPYYEAEGVTIYHGDSRHVLASMGDDSVDLVLTDPPYAIGLDYGESFVDDDDYLRGVVMEVVAEARRVAPAVLLTSGVRNIHSYPPPQWTLAWLTLGAPGRGPWGFTTWHPVLAYGRDPYLRRRRGSRPDTVKGQMTSHEAKAWNALKADHPCPKPIGPWQKILLRGSPDETDVILDPFMGAGTTLVAARNLGRRAIGIEIEERYCEVAARRLEAAAELAA